MQAFAALAVSTGDHVLAAAVMSTLDGMKSKRERDQTGVTGSALVSARTEFSE
jgi:hypothetical protein